MSPDRRLAHATNEKSASEPSTLSGLKRVHGNGCSCCSGRSLRPKKSSDRPAAKSFPTRRPWMLSH
jgi:hypothetical protein